MTLSDAIDAALAVLRIHPSDLLPLYFFIPAIPMIIRVISLVGIAAAISYLYVTNRLDTLITHFSELDMGLPPPDADPEAIEMWVESIIPLVELAFPLPVIVLLVASFILSIVFAILLYSALTAGQYAGCLARLRSERGLVNAIAGARRFWVPILLARLLEFGAWVTITVLLLGAIAVTAMISPIAGVLVGLFGVLIWLIFAAVIRAIFVFVPVSIVVDKEGIVEGIRQSFYFIRSNPGSAIGYYIIAIGMLVGVSTVTAMGAPFGAATLISIVGIVVITPFLDLVKIALYAGSKDGISPPEPVSTSTVQQQLRYGGRKAWSEMIEFVKLTPGLHVIAAGFLGLGFIIGWVAASPLDGIISTSIEARLAGHIPPIAALEFGGNNWLVVITTAYSGIIIGIPSLISLWFNGLVFGGVARLEVVPIELLLFVIPHGIFEIPALVIAGALGLAIGGSSWRVVRGRAPNTHLADRLESAFWIVIGVGFLIATAALIEGFISPYYYRFIL